MFPDLELCVIVSVVHFEHLIIKIYYFGHPLAMVVWFHLQLHRSGTFALNSMWLRSGRMDGCECEIDSYVDVDHTVEYVVIIYFETATVAGFHFNFIISLFFGIYLTVWWVLARHSTASTREYEESYPGPPGSEKSTLPLGHCTSPGWMLI